MTKKVKWLLLVSLALFAWWFFQGDNPMQLVRQFAGRGKKLSSTTMTNGQDVDQTIDEVTAQVVAAMGRDVARDAVILARVSANEHPGASEREKQAIQWVCKNDADSHGWSLGFTTTTTKGSWGMQAGRRYSTHGEDFGTHVGTGIYEIHEDDLFVAESILNGSLPDITGGAAKFVHITGYDSFADFVQGHPHVAQWLADGLVPVYLGGVSTLVILLPKDRVTSGMDTGASVS